MMKSYSSVLRICLGEPRDVICVELASDQLIEVVVSIRDQSHEVLVHSDSEPHFVVIWINNCGCFIGRRLLVERF